MKQADADGLDTGLAPWRSRRGRRAAALIAMSAIAVVVAGYTYLLPTLTVAEQPATIASSPEFQSPLPSIAYSVVNRSLAWALVTRWGPTDDLGQFWVFVTVDGAKHWRQQLAGKSSFITVTMRSFRFLDRKNGYLAAGIPIQLYRTGDGGGHWTTAALPDPGPWPLTFSDPQQGWFRASTPSAPPFHPVPEIYATGDGGDTWRKLPDPPADIGELSFRSPFVGWGGSYGMDQAHVYSTTDGGLSWRRHDLPVGGFPTGTEIGSRINLLPGSGLVAFVNANREFDFTSFDDGNSWKSVTARPSGANFGGTIGFQDALNWWAIDTGTLYKSSDAGQSWTQIVRPGVRPESSYFFLRVLDPNSAWAQIDFPDGTGLGITEDGGLHWTRVPVPRPA